jgi:DNA-binding NtrC family response regulator
MRRRISGPGEARRPSGGFSAAESMPTILLVGRDVALMEGLAQLLASVGHRSVIAASLGEARSALGNERPLVAVLDRIIASGSDIVGFPVLPGGAIVLFSTTEDAASPLTPAVQRAILSELTLPLERQRLIALVASVAARSHTTGRTKANTPPEHRAAGK